MPVQLLQQNMRNFGGGDPARTGAYHAAFGAIAAAAPTVDVGGFSEVTNDIAAAAAFDAPNGLCNAAGLEPVACVNAGQTALAAHGEFEVLGVRLGAVVHRVGRIMFTHHGGAYHLEHDVAADAPGTHNFQQWSRNLPNAAHVIADFRGVVYMVVTLPGGGPTIAVGFAHNRAGAAVNPHVAEFRARENDMLRLMRTPLAGGAPAIQHAYLGVDNNLPPAAPGPGAHHPIHEYAAPVTAATPGLTPAAVAAHAGIGGTTWTGGAAHLLDYWISDIDPAGPAAPLAAGGVAHPVASVRADTMTGPAGGHHPMSDHAASLLRVV